MYICLISISQLALCLQHFPYPYLYQRYYMYKASKVKCRKATLKKKIVSGPAAGCVYNCRMGTFFFHFAPPPPKKIMVKISLFSYQKKKKGKKEFCDRPTGHNFGHPLDRKQTFFKGGLTISPFCLRAC